MSTHNMIVKPLPILLHCGANRPILTLNDSSIMSMIHSKPNMLW